MNNHTIKAYTFIELVVVMMITAIVISITYTAYGIISRSYLSFNKKNAEMGTLLRMDELLRNDFKKADAIFSTSDSLVLTNASNAVHYKFNPEYIVRSSTITDTFKVKATDIIKSFEGEPVIQSADSTQMDLIDNIGFTAWLNDRKIPYIYHKQYSSANLIQIDTNAVN